MKKSIIATLILAATGTAALADNSLTSKAMSDLISRSPSGSTGNPTAKPDFRQPLGQGHERLASLAWRWPHRQPDREARHRQPVGRFVRQGHEYQLSALAQLLRRATSPRPTSCPRHTQHNSPELIGSGLSFCGGVTWR